MISKKSFVKVIKAYQKHVDFLDAGFNALGLNNAFDSPLFDSLYDILDAVVDDVEPDWDEALTYAFIFDYKYGTDYGDECLYSLNGVDYKPTTLEELYDCIVKLSENK